MFLIFLLSFSSLIFTFLTIYINVSESTHLLIIYDRLGSAIFCLNADGGSWHFEISISSRFLFSWFTFWSCFGLVYTFFSLYIIFLIKCLWFSQSLFNFLLHICGVFQIHYRILHKTPSTLLLSNFCLLVLTFNFWVYCFIIYIFYILVY